ncbi:MAG: hypothetical protein ACKVWR_00945 [Acidimicrobiales bacterium]
MSASPFDPAGQWGARRCDGAAGSTYCTGDGLTAGLVQGPGAVWAVVGVRSVSDDPPPPPEPGAGTAAAAVRS